MKIAFLDRDGTIIKDYPDNMWKDIKSPEFLDGSIETLQHIKDRGFEIIIITNQYLIGEGIITLEDYQKFNDLFLKTLKQNGINVLDVFYCPHSRIQNCDCIKPKPGLINQAIHKYPDINLSSSLYVGDSDCDKELAKAFKIKFYGINLDCDNNISSLKDVIRFLN